MQASKCHASQGGAGMQLKGFPKFVQRKMLGSETFTLVEPAPNGRRYFERDLFEGISL
jgi:hypothetical protein